MMTSNQTIGLFDNNGLSIENVDLSVVQLFCQSYRPIFEFSTNVYHDQSFEGITKCLIKDGVLWHVCQNLGYRERMT